MSRTQIRNNIVTRIAIIVAVNIGFCQSQTPKITGPQFEVATVKPSPEPPTHFAYSITDRRADLGTISLKVLIQMAYKVELYQIEGPDWTNSSRFDILAKLPEGATKEQVPEMLQALLSDRFGLVLHREAKEQSAYALLPGKDGPKMKEGAADNTHPDLSFLNGRRILSKMDTEDGFWTISTSNEGRRIFDGSRITMAELARTLAPYLDDEPVVDMTGLKGNWQISLEVPTVRQMRNQATSDPDGGVSIFASVQRLGLRLEKRKAPVEHLVVDHVDKTPKEN